mmetsp:Transcript_80526/g.126889  ORF Transcript_80526/g.126889 Transcript_80526/m.126889 type:complete len:157 (-) Transcript_80526:163-633(-)|eukprot:CAMPEP_0169086788 /NCGR_PEP_ID=MMETSP1015-20121227/13886_1 /TAXON_ID=342587 /ORGANISM="Karlodinium micrum, Strain CCMP2283" /LENGTH=156 /DNA_ID=CAMNT_0009146977 /DNA_START=74 /DNA_END=544 /DNA_ORIENTATION=-
MPGAWREASMIAVALAFAVALSGCGDDDAGCSPIPTGSGCTSPNGMGGRDCAVAADFTECMSCESGKYPTVTRTGCPHIVSGIMWYYTCIAVPAGDPTKCNSAIGNDCIANPPTEPMACTDNYTPQKVAEAADPVCSLTGSATGVGEFFTCIAPTR